MSENPYQAPRIPAEADSRPPPKGLRIDWYGLIRAHVVLILLIALYAGFAWLLDWLAYRW